MMPNEEQIKISWPEINILNVDATLFNNLTFKEMLDIDANKCEFSREAKINKLNYFRKQTDIAIMAITRDIVYCKLELDSLRKELSNNYNLFKYHEYTKSPESMFYDKNTSANSTISMFCLSLYFDMYCYESKTKYKELLISAPLIEEHLKKAVDLKYFLEGIFHSINQKIDPKKPVKTKNTEFNQYQTVMLFNLLRELSFFDKNLTNTVLGETINMLTGFSHSQTVKYFSELSDEDRYSKNKVELKKLLEAILHKLD